MPIHIEEDTGMKKNTANKKVLRAISIGLAAMMAIQPVMATPVYADDDNEPDENVAPESEESTSFESNDSSEGLETIQETAVVAENSTNMSSCGNALDQAVSAGRDSSEYAEFDKNGGQALNAALEAITNEQTGIQNLDDKFSFVDSEGNVKVDSNGNAIVLDVEGDRRKVADDAQKLVEEAKRGVSADYDNTSGADKIFDAYEIMQKVNDETLEDSLTGKNLTDAAAALDTAITNQSKELGAYNTTKEVEVIEDAGVSIAKDIETIENATSLDTAKTALDNAEAAKDESNVAYEEALEKYNSVSAAYEEEKATIEKLKEDYKALLESQIADDSYIRQAEKELKQAQENLTKLENDAKKAQTNLANTVIGKMADAFSKTKSSENWTELDTIFKDVIKYYYLPMVEKVDPSNVEFVYFEKNLKDANYLEVKVNGVSRYFNYKSKYSNYNGKAYNDKIVIFEKNKEVEVAEHYEDSNNQTVDVNSAVDILNISSVENGLVVKANGDTDSKFYKVTSDGTTTELENTDGVTYTYNDGDVTEEYAIDSNGNLVKTKVATSVIKTTYKNVSLSEKAVEVEYTSEDDARNAAGVQANLLGANATFDGVKVDSYSEFSTTIDLTKVVNKAEGEKASKFAAYVNERLEGSANLSSDGTFKITSNDSIDELKEKIKNDTIWTGFKSVTNGNVSLDDVKNLLRTAIAAIENSTPASTRYKLTLLGVSYDEILSTDTLSNQVVSTTTWAADELTHVATTYKAGVPTLNENYTNYVENGIKNGAIIDLRDANDVINKAVREDIAKVNALKDKYKKAESAAKTSRQKVENAQAKVNDLINAIQKEIDSLDGKVSARLAQLEGQLLAAKAELSIAEVNNNLVNQAYDDAKKAYDDAEARLTRVPETSGTSASSTGSGSSSSSGTTGTSTGTTTVAAFPASEASAITSAVPAAGVAGARVENNIGDDIGGNKLHSEGGKIIEEAADGQELIADELPAGTEEEKLEKDSKKIVKTIEDEDIPLAAFPDESSKKMNWWWLLIIALLGATGEEMYRRNKKKKEEKARLSAEMNK